VVALPAIETREASPTATAPAGAAPALVEFVGVGERCGRLRALAGLDLAVPSGDFLVLYGPPASGKTTPMRIVAGLERPTRGEVYFGPALGAQLQAGPVWVRLPADRVTLFAGQGHRLAARLTDGASR
jgi:ABC-type branched-subunit amino acid transport system ATPase component